MSAVIEAPAPATVATKAENKPTLKATLLALYAAERPAMVALAAKYANVAYAVTTKEGLAEAKAARHDVRENGRFLLQRMLDSLKAQANELKGIATAETEALIALIRPVEDAIDEQVKAEEKRLADLKAEEERLEADRKQKLLDAIAGIRATALRADGQAAAKIKAAADAMATWTFPKERWQEFAVQAANATCETIEKLRQLHAAAVAKESAPASTPAPEPQIVAEPHRGPVPEPQPIGVHVGPPAEAVPCAGNVATLPNGDKADADTGEVLERADTVTCPSGGWADPARGDTVVPAATLITGSKVACFDGENHGTVAVDAAPSGDDKPTFNVGDICGRFGRGCNLTSEFIEDTLGVTHTGRGHRGIKLWSEKDVRSAAQALMLLAQRVAMGGAA